jgi:DNA polymerase-1
MIYLVSNNKQLFQTNIYKECSINDVKDWLNNNKQVEFDTETTGFEAMTCKVLCYQFGNKDNQFIIDATSFPLTLFTAYFENANYLWLGQNIKFDLRFLLNIGVDIWKMNVYDTMLGECLLLAGLEEAKYGLDALVWKYCNQHLDKSVRGEININGLTTRVIQYAAGDVTYLGEIKRQQLELIKERDLERVMELEMQVTKIFAEMEYHGFKLNQTKWLKAAEEGETNANKLAEELDTLLLSYSELRKFCKKYTQSQMFGFTSRLVDVNYDSPLQMSKVFNSLGLKLESTDAKELEKINHPFVQKFIEYKKQQKLVKTYGKSMLKMVRPDGSITTSFWQMRDTGRVSSGDTKKGYPNLQNLPATDTYRNPFEVDEGEVLIDADFAGMEAVLAAEVSNEENWITANNEGLDLHSINCEMVFKDKWKHTALPNCDYYQSKQKCKCPEHKKMRDKIKTTTYLYLFGGGASKLSKQLNISKQEAQNILNDFETSLPNLRGVVTNVRNFAKRNLYIRTMKPFMRRRYFEDYSKMTDEYRSSYVASLERQSFNTVIQGSGADITKQAMINIKQKLVDLAIPHKFRLQVHDALMLSTPEQYGEQVKDITVQGMIDAGKLVCKKANLGADAYIAKYWQK